MPSETLCLPHIRTAAPQDAPAITELYAEAYRPPDGGDAKDHYPFPQVLNPEWVAYATGHRKICWVVADDGGAIVGSAAALRNIGSEQDRVAEVFGIVVRSTGRSRGVGTRLLNGLEAELTRDPSNTPTLVMCEARTAVSAAWKIAKNGGFFPIGFEPFAHATPAGSEAMLPTGKLLAGNASLRDTLSPLSLASLKLGTAVLNGCRLPASLAGTGEGYALEPAHPMRAVDGAGLDEFPTGDLVGPLTGARAAHMLGMLRFDHDDAAGKEFLDQWPEAEMHASGVVGLRRLEGEDLGDHRYARQFYVGRIGPRILCAARVVWDRVDLRARILDLQTQVEGIQGLLLARIADSLQVQTGAERLVLVVDVRGDALRLQVTLEALGFVPTVYYPGLLGDARTRRDAVQYTRLFNCDFQESVKYVTGLDWHVARTVVQQVTDLFGSFAASTAGALGIATTP